MKAETNFGRRRAVEIAIEVLREPCAVYRPPMRKTRDLAARELQRLLDQWRKSDRDLKARAKVKKTAAQS
jgi:hypothetical protein